MLDKIEEEILELRNALRRLRIFVAVDLQDQVSLCGAFDKLVDLAKAGTFGDSVKKIQKVNPRKAYTKRATSAAPAESDGDEESDEESSDEESVTEEAATE